MKYRTYTPRQLRDEMMESLRIELNKEQRKKSVAKMTGTSKALLAEIIAQYGEKESAESKELDK